jgi:hypothetical protein
MRRIVFGLTVLFALAAPAHADVINAIDSGWYNSAGMHVAQNNNYIVGDASGTERRNFVVFDLTTVTDEILSASLDLYNPDDDLPALRGYVSPDPTESLALYEVTTAVDDVRLSQTGAAGVAIFDDLGSGVVFGERSVSAADNGTVVSIVINANGLAALNAARGGLFAIGGALTTLGSVGDEYVFGFSQSIGNPEVRQLTIETAAVPEPVSASLLALGLLLTVLRRRHPKST